MKIHLHFNFHIATLNVGIPSDITDSLERIIMDMGTLQTTLTALVGTVSDIGTQLATDTADLQAVVTNLQNELAAGAQTTPAVDSLLADLQSKLGAIKDTATKLDDIGKTDVGSTGAGSTGTDASGTAVDTSGNSGDGSGTAPPSDGDQTVAT